MKLPLIAPLALAVLTAVASASDNGNGSGTFVVASPHGGYNVIQGGGQPSSIGFFGFHGFAARTIAESHDKRPKFILRPRTEDVGQGSKIVVYKRIYFATPEEAAAANLKQ